MRSCVLQLLLGGALTWAGAAAVVLEVGAGSGGAGRVVVLVVVVLFVGAGIRGSGGAFVWLHAVISNSRGIAFKYFCMISPRVEG